MASEEDFKQFAYELQELLLVNPNVRLLVATLDDTIRSPEDTPDKTDVIDFPFVSGGVSLFTAYTMRFLYCWAKDFIYFRRSVQEVEIVKQRVRLIDDLVDGGWNRDAATKVVISQLEVLSKRADDDNAIKNILGMLRNNNKAQ